MAAILRGEIDSGRKAWLLVQQDNPTTAAVQAELQGVFERAGWPVEAQRYPAPLKAGVTLLAADEEPPAFVTTVHDAISAAGIDIRFLTGYRDYYGLKKSEDPSWRGPELVAEQPFVIVIGSLPTPKADE